MSTVSLIAFGFFRKQSRYAGLWTMLQEWGKSIGDWTLNVEHSPNLKSTYLYMMSLADGIGWFQLCKLLNQELDNLCHHCQRKFSVKRSCMLLCVGGMVATFVSTLRNHQQSVKWSQRLQIWVKVSSTALLMYERAWRHCSDDRKNDARCLGITIYGYSLESPPA